MQNPPPGRAVEYLTAAFGFIQRMKQTGGAGRMHTELVLGEDGLVMLGQAGNGFKNPKRLDAYPSVLVHFYVDDADALHERARAAGADVTDLETAAAGDRQFTATDPEGQVWVFAQRVE